MAIPPRERRTTSVAHRREARGAAGGPAPTAEAGPARLSRGVSAEHPPVRQVRQTLTSAELSSAPALLAVSGDAELISLSSERRELLCSVIGLAVKLGLVAVAGVSLFRLAGAYQQRMERQNEINAVLELQSARLGRARDRFDELFMTEGEQRLIREQSQWIAPNRMRVVWQDHSSASSVETASANRAVEGSSGSTPRP